MTSLLDGVHTAVHRVPIALYCEAITTRAAIQYIHMAPTILLRYSAIYTMLVWENISIIQHPMEHTAIFGMYGCVLLGACTDSKYNCVHEPLVYFVWIEDSSAIKHEEGMSSNRCEICLHIALLKYFCTCQLSCNIIGFYVCIYY